MSHRTLTPRTIFLFTIIAGATGCTALLGSFDVGGDTAPGTEAGPDVRVDSPVADAPVQPDASDGGDGGGDAGCKVTPGGVLLDDAVTVAPGYNHTCAIRQDGALYCWGDNSFGQLGIPQVTALSSNKPVKVEFPATLGNATIKQVALSEATTFAIDSQLRLWAWGNNESGMLAIGSKDSNPHDVPAIVRNGTAPLLTRAIAPEWFGACALSTTSDVLCWGTNGSGQLGTVQAVGVDSFTPVKAFSSVGAAGPSAILSPGIGSAYACYAPGPAVDNMRCWGNKSQGVLLADLGVAPPNNGVNYDALKPLVVAGAKAPLAQVVFGTNYGAALDGAGRAFTWGTNNGQGVHGPGAAPAAGSAVNVPGSWTSISAGYVFMCAISPTKRLHCRGSNTQGQLGRDTSVVGDNAKMDPVVVGIPPNDKPLERVASVGAGFFHACAIVEGTCGPKGPGQVKCWGEGAKGQLGDDRATASPIPVDVKAP